jgi:hypothetical protein
MQHGETSLSREYEGRLRSLLDMQQGRAFRRPGRLRSRQGTGNGVRLGSTRTAGQHSPVRLLLLWIPAFWTRCVAVAYT